MNELRQTIHRIVDFAFDEIAKLPKPAVPEVQTPKPVESLDPKSDKLAYSIKETAAMLGLSYMTVNRLLARGKLRALGSIRHKIIPKTEIERFFRNDLGK